MKVLSLKQPFPWLILHGGEGWKDVENRVWSTKHRGPFLIHASKSMTRDYYDWAVAFARKAAPQVVVPPMEDLRQGGIVGMAEITAVIQPCVGINEDYNGCRCGRPWHFGRQYGYLLARPKPLPFTRLRGMQNFFHCPREVLHDLGVLDPVTL